MQKFKMIFKTALAVLILLATIGCATMIGAMLSMASWTFNILGIILIPIFIVCIFKLVKLIFLTYGK